MVSDHAAPIVVYGAGAPSFRLRGGGRHSSRSGYINVADFRGGLREWEAAGLPVVSEAPLPEPPSLLGAYAVDTAASVIRWTGRNLFNFHHGRVGLSGGRVEWRDDTLQRATFTIDLGSIVCEDLDDSSLNAALIRICARAEFFQVDLHPVATFETTRVTRIPTRPLARRIFRSPATSRCGASLAKSRFPP